MCWVPEPAITVARIAAIAPESLLMTIDPPRLIRVIDASPVPQPATSTTAESARAGRVELGMHTRARRYLGDSTVGCPIECILAPPRSNALAWRDFLSLQSSSTSG